jgi:hypothetical protein
VKDLIAAIEAFIDGWNERCQPFVWTKTADEILAKPTVNKLQTRDTRCQSARPSPRPMFTGRSVCGSNIPPALQTIAACDLLPRSGPTTRHIGCHRASIASTVCGCKSTSASIVELRRHPEQVLQLLYSWLRRSLDFRYKAIRPALAERLLAEP